MTQMKLTITSILDHNVDDGSVCIDMIDQKYVDAKNVEESSVE